MPSAVSTARIRQPENHAIIDSSQSSRCARESQITSWPCSVSSLIAMVLPMVPVGTNSAASLPAISAARCFQPVDGGVLAVDVVAHLGFEHGLPHRRRRAWSRYRFADRSCVKNSWKTSFETITPRGSAAAARRRRSIMPLDRNVEGSADARASRRRRRPRLRSAAGPRKLLFRRMRGRRLVVHAPRRSASARRSPCAASTFCQRITPSKECASAPKPDIRLAPPILQVVQRFSARPREIGDLVARNAMRARSATASS